MAYTRCGSALTWRMHSSADAHRLFASSRTRSAESALPLKMPIRLPSRAASPDTLTLKSRKPRLQYRRNCHQYAGYGASPRTAV